jgi:small subunit ribosomal protein S9
MPEKKITTKKEVTKPLVKKTAPKVAAKPAVKAVAKPVEKPVLSRVEGEEAMMNGAEPMVEVKRIVKDVKFEGRYIAVMGKRKTAAAQVRLYENGVGAIMVNGKPSDIYFESLEARAIVNSILKMGADIYNFSILVNGGGKLGQAEAVRHGITNALIKINPELRPALKAKSFTTRDARKKERKKPGLKRARRAPQWSKR